MEREGESELQALATRFVGSPIKIEPVKTQSRGGLHVKVELQGRQTHKDKIVYLLTD